MQRKIKINGNKIAVVEKWTTAIFSNVTVYKTIIQ